MFPNKIGTQAALVSGVQSAKVEGVHQVPSNDEFSDSESGHTASERRFGLSLPSSSSQIFVPEFQGHGAYRKSSSSSKPLIKMASQPTDQSIENSLSTYRQHLVF